MGSIFSKIINGDISAYKIKEDQQHLAFLDIFPLAEGHVLVVPKKEVDYIFDIDSQEYTELWKFAKDIAIAMKKVIKCQRIGVAVVGLEVPHTHIHLIPINSIEDINFGRSKLEFSDEDFKRITLLIQSAN